MTLAARETRFYRREEIYRAIARELTLPGGGRGGLTQLFERWIARQVRAVMETDNVSEDHPAHDKAVTGRIERALGKVGAEAPSFAMALGAYYAAKRQEDFTLARGLSALLAGDPSVGATVRRSAGLKGELEGPMAFGYLRALLEVVHATGLSGLAVVFDEGDRLTQLRPQERRDTWEVLRQLLDEVNEGRFPGLYLVLTGTPQLFEGKSGIREYGALEQRLSVKFSDDEPDDLRQRQIRLRGMDRERLKSVARRVRDIFPADSPDRVTARAGDNLIDAIATEVTKGFGGAVAVAPRVFLREWVRVLDLIDQHAEYDPSVRYKFDLKAQIDLSSQEKVAAGLAQSVEGEIPPTVF